MRFRFSVMMMYDKALRTEVKECSNGPAERRPEPEKIVLRIYMIQNIIHNS